MRSEYYLTPRLWQRARKACTEAPGTLTSERQMLKVMTRLDTRYLMSRYILKSTSYMSNNDPELDNIDKLLTNEKLVLPGLAAVYEVDEALQL